MRGTVNKMLLLGRLGQDPDIRATAGGTQIVAMNIATNELGDKDEQSGIRSNRTEWHRVILVGRNAEVAAQYLKKGSLVFICGHLKTRKFKDLNGYDRYTTEIIGDELQMMGGNDDAAGRQYNQAMDQAKDIHQQSYDNQQRALDV